MGLSSQALLTLKTQLLYFTEFHCILVLLSPTNMSGVKTCVKLTLIIFNIISAIIGAVIIGLGVLYQMFTDANGEHLEGYGSAPIILYAVGIITLVIAILGACGAYKERKAILIIYLVCTVLGCLMMLRVGVNAALNRPQKDTLEDKFRHFLPLDQASSEVKALVNDMQTQMHCCGLFSYKDW